MTYWHKYNPWADKVVYIPDLKEFSACVNASRDDPDYYYHICQGYHDLKVDAYILPQPSGYHDAGIRFGAEDDEYYSPSINRYIAQLLLDKYKLSKEEKLAKWLYEQDEQPKPLWHELKQNQPQDYKKLVEKADAILRWSYTL